MCQNLDLRFLLFYCLFVKFFFRPFRFFDLAFYCVFSFFDLVFYRTLFPPFFFCSCFVPVFLAHVVSSLAYPNLLVNKRLWLLLLLIKCTCAWISFSAIL
jgi:hypothetical protein